MAVTALHLLSAGSNTDTQEYTTASITPTANALVLLAFEGRNIATGSPTPSPTVVGCNLTWVAVDSETSGNDSQNITVFRAMGASPSAGALTITQGGSGNIYGQWSISEFHGIDTSGTNGSGAIVQSNGNSDTATNTGLTITLTAFSNANNATYGVVRSVGGGSITNGTGFTELGESGGTDSNIQSQWRNDNDISVDWSWTSTDSNARGIAIEIKSAIQTTATIDSGHSYFM